MSICQFFVVRPLQTDGEIFLCLVKNSIALDIYSVLEYYFLINFVIECVTLTPKTLNLNLHKGRHT